MARKFDFIIGNPPYTNGLDIKIHKVLEECLEPRGRIAFVQPSGFLLSRRETSRKSYDIDTSKMDYVHLLWGNSIFNIGLFVPVAVSYWRRDKDSPIVAVKDDAYTDTTYICAYNQIHLYGENYPWLKEWLDGVPAPDGTVHSHFLKKSNDEYGILLSARGTPPKGMGAFYFSVRGHPPRGEKQEKLADDFFTVVPKDEAKVKEHFVPIDTICRIHARCILCFHSEAELNNFVGYVKTKCVRFILSMCKTNQQLWAGELGKVPWMDFTKEYSDEKLRKLWNIDDRLWEFIDTHIPDYYLDYRYN